MPGTDAKSLCDFLDVHQRDIFLRPFNHTYIGTMHLRCLSELLLRDAEFDAFIADILAKPDEDLFLLDHRASVGTC